LCCTGVELELLCSGKKERKKERKKRKKERKKE
jgi:hypothetical protein